MDVDYQSVKGFVVGTRAIATRHENDRGAGRCSRGTGDQMRLADVTMDVPRVIAAGVPPAQVISMLSLSWGGTPETAQRWGLRQGRGGVSTTSVRRDP